MNTDVVLIAATYDPEGQIGALLPEQLPLLLSHFAHVAVLCRDGTAPETFARLVAGGVEVLRNPDLPVNPRPAMLHIAHARPEWAFVHMEDLDSALHWAWRWPDELDHIHITLHAYDFALLGRSARAIATIPDAQRLTEAVINTMFAACTGGVADWRIVPDDSGAPVDICTGAWGFSRRGIVSLATQIQEMSIGFHAEWPLIARDTPGLRCAYLPTEGLEYETADRYAPEITAAGGYDAWVAESESNPARWRQRTQYINEVADFLTMYRHTREM